MADLGAAKAGQALLLILNLIPAKFIATKRYKHQFCLSQLDYIVGFQLYRFDHLFIIKVSEPFTVARQQPESLFLGIVTDDGMAFAEYSFIILMIHPSCSSAR